MGMLHLAGRRTRPLFNFILQPEFPINGLILASEALRIANQNSGEELFRWTFVSETGDAVHTSNGMWFPVDCAVREMESAEVYLIFEGNLPTQRNSRVLLNQLRAAARSGAIVGGVDTGAFALAQAGLIGTDDSPVVLHWEAVPAFQERFASVPLLNQIYLVTDKRAHCAGGVATLDLILDLIAGFRDEALANEVANALVHTRRLTTTQQRSDSAPEADQSPVVGRLVSLMERNLDFPLSLEDLAEKLDVSSRTLTRACRRVIGESPMRLYLHVRLQAARNFLFYEESSIKDVANACGFSYPAVFSRAFKDKFGQTPREFREAIRQRQSAAVRPEIRRLMLSRRLAD